MTHGLSESLGLDLVDLILLEVLMALIEAPSHGCVIGQSIATLPEPTRGMFATLVDSPVSADKLAVAMRDEAIPGSASAIRSHRRGECVCHLSKGTT
jgi:hypothetical protein